MRTNQTAPAAPASDATPAGETTELQVAAPVTIEETPAPAVSAGEPDEAPQTPHSRAMADIVASRRRVLEAEQAAAVQSGFQPDGAEPQADPQTTPAAAPVPASAPSIDGGDTSSPAAPPVPEGSAVRTHKITVRGQILDLSDDDLRRAAELGVDSEIRIRQANATLAEAQRIAQTNSGAGASSPPAATPPAPSSTPPGQDRAAFEELAQEIMYGDATKVADALQRALAGRAAPVIDPDQIAGQAFARVQQTLQLQQSLNTFATEYGEIAADPDLATLAANYVQQLRGHYAQTGTQRDELSLFREAGNAVRTAMGRWGAPMPEAGGNAAPPQQAQPAALTEGPRTVIKRNMPQAPAAGAAQLSTPAAPARTASDIINDMRKARGQPVYG